MTQHQNPATMDFGAFALTSPDGSHRIPPDMWPDVALAVATAPESAVQAVYAAKVAFALSGRVTAPSAALSRVRNRPEEEFAHVARLNAPLRDPEIAEKIERKAAQAARHLARADELRAENPKKNRTAAKTLEKLAHKLGDEIAVLIAEEQDQQLWGEARGPMLAARARGEAGQVDYRETAEIATDEHGARIINQSGPDRGLPALVYSRGARSRLLRGIDHALADGHLEGASGIGAEELHRVGRFYRSVYEIVEGQATNAGSEGGGGGFGPKSPQPRVVEAGEDLAIMRRALSPQQRKVLDLVCGLDRRLRECADAIGSGTPVAKRLLVTGLKAARDAHKAARETGERQEHAERIADMTAALRGVRG